MKVLVADPISEEGIKILCPCSEVDVKTSLKPEELIAIIGEYDGLIVRSQTQVTDKVIEAGKKLQVIARAGTGVDNVNLEAATRCGVIVVNAPTGNTISAAEHTIGLMLALSRNIPQANASLKSGAWKRNLFMGTEVRGKTLGIIGLGNVGAEVARRAHGMEMKLIGYDPFVSAEHARSLQVELVPLETLYKESDYITLHIPLTKVTKGMIGAKELAMMKPTVRIINCARGGLIDEEALAQAAKEKKIGGAAIDVFSTEPITQSPLFEPDNIVVTPHLGASTTEAQAMAAIDVVEQIIDIFKGQPARHAVNAPFISPEALSVLSPYIQVATKVGRLTKQLTEGQMSSIKIKYEGEISGFDTKILKSSVLGGLLEEVSEERVNIVNADLIAARRGLSVMEQRESTCENYMGLITVEATTSAGITTAAGTIIRNQVHIVRVNNYWIDIVPAEGYFLFVDHKDRPGLMGTIGGITGDADINISSMNVSRLKPRGQALAVLALDEALPAKQQKKMLSVPDIYSVKTVKL